MVKRMAGKVRRTRGKTAVKAPRAVITPKPRGRQGSAISVTVSEARKRLSELVNRVAYGGETVILEKHGKPVAKLVPHKPNVLSSLSATM
jgi:prevent-host-death family protein